MFIFYNYICEMALFVSNTFLKSSSEIINDSDVKPGAYQTEFFWFVHRFAPSIRSQFSVGLLQNLKLKPQTIGTHSGKYVGHHICIFVKSLNSVSAAPTCPIQHGNKKYQPSGRPKLIPQFLSSLLAPVTRSLNVPVSLPNQLFMYKVTDSWCAANKMC